jgi:hypothetical protein
MDSSSYEARRSGSSTLSALGVGSVLLDGMIKKRQDIPKEVLRQLRKLLGEVS